MTSAARRQAFLEAADVASQIRDEYEAMGKNVANGVRTRERYNRDATVARQIKGAILARASIQEWPAPKPKSGPGAGLTTPSAVHGLAVRQGPLGSEESVTLIQHGDADV